MIEDDLREELFQTKEFQDIVRAFGDSLGVDVFDPDVISVIKDCLSTSYIMGYNLAWEIITEKINAMPKKMDEATVERLTDEIISQIEAEEPH